MGDWDAVDDLVEEFAPVTRVNPESVEAVEATITPA